MTVATVTTFCATCPRPLDTAAVLSNATTCTDCECARLRPSSEWSIFVRALHEAESGGRVHQSAVRPLVRGRLKPQSIGKCYSRAIREGLLVEIGRERSDDVAGRNTNKWEPYYELRSAA